MAYDKDNLSRLRSTLLDLGYEPPELERFTEDMKDDTNLENVRKTLKRHKYTPPEFDEFKSDMFGISLTPYSWEGRTMMPADMAEQRVMTDASDRHATKQSQPQQQTRVQQVQQAQPQQKRQQRVVPSWKARAGMQLVANQGRTNAIGRMPNPARQLTGNTLKMDQGKRAGAVSRDGRAEVQTSRQQRAQRSAESMQDPNMIIEQMLGSAGGFQGEDAVAEIRNELPEHYEWLTNRMGGIEADNMLKQNLAWRSIQGDMDAIYNEEKQMQAERESEATQGLGLGNEPEDHFLNLYIRETARRRAGDESGTLDRMVDRVITESPAARNWYEQRVNELMKQSRQAALKDMERRGAPGTRMFFDDMMSPVQARAIARGELRNMFRNRDVQRMMPGGDGMFVAGSAAAQNLWARFGRWAISAGSGDYESDRMIDEAFGLYSQEQASTGARIAAPVATLVTDIISGGFYPAGAAAKGVTWLGMRGLTTAGMRVLGVGAEQTLARVGSNWGSKLLLSSLGGAANFGVYEMESTALTGAGQGTFDLGDVGHAGVSGAVKGLIFGVVGGAMGKVTEGMKGTTALLGELATISAEGTVFTAMDVWETGELTPESVGTSFGMALGGRAAHPAEYAAGLYARVKGLNQQYAPKEPPRINQETYDKLVGKGYRGIAELLKDSSFAKDIVDALRGKRVNAGTLEGNGTAIEGRDYEKQRAKANMDALAKELEAMENDPDVDWQTLRKAKYVLNGEFVPEPTAMGWGVRTDDKGNMVGVTLDAQQRVINTFKLKGENDRKAWQEETSRQVDINAVRLGAQTVRTQEMREATVEAILETAREMGVNPKDAVDAWNKPEKERTADEKTLVETTVGRAKDLLEKKGSFADRATEIVEDKYGVKIDDLLKRPVNRRTQQEQQALEELLQRLNGTYNEAKDKSDAEIIQDEKAQAHDDGYNVEDARKSELQQKMQAARDKLLQMGYSDAWIEKFEQMRPEEVADFLKKTAPEETDAVMDYLGSKAAYDGMLDRVDERIEEEVQKNNAEVDKRVHNPEMGGDGMVRRVTLRDGRTVYVTGGKLAVKDGAVDSKNSDSFLTVYDEASGKPDSIDIGDIGDVEDPVSPDQLKQESGKAIAEDIASKEVHLINGDIDFKEGEEYQIGDVTIKVVGNDGDNVMFLQGDNPYPIARDRHELSEMVKESERRMQEQEVPAGEPVQSAGPRDMTETEPAKEPAADDGVAVEEEQHGMPMTEDNKPDWEGTTPDVAYDYLKDLGDKDIEGIIAKHLKRWEEAAEKAQEEDDIEGLKYARDMIDYWHEVEALHNSDKQPADAAAETAAEQRPTEQAGAPAVENEMRPVEEEPAEGGISDSERENWKDVDNGTVDMLNDLAKELGLTVRTDDLPEGDRGYYDRDTNEIVVNRNEDAADKVIFVLSHELTHGLEQRSEETSMFGVYDAYKKAALEMRRYLLESKGESYDEYVQNLIDRYANHNMWEAYNRAKDAGKSDTDAMKAAKAAYNEVDEAYVEREMTCDITGEMMKRPELAKEVFNRIQDKSKMERLKDWIVNFIRRIKGKKGTVTNESKRWNDLADKFEQMYKEVITERKEEARMEKSEAKVEEEGVHSETQAAAVDSRQFSITTEPTLEENLRKYAKTTDGKRLKWNADKINGVIHETADLIRAIHNALNGDPFYDEFAGKEPTVRVDWRDGEEHPVVTWSRNNVEYKYDMSADLLCVNNDGLEEVLSSPSMCDLMVKMFENEVARNGGKTYTIKKETDKETGEVKEKKEYIAGGFTSEDYINLYNMLRDMGFVVPCRGCFDAAARLKMLPSVSQKFENLVNDIIMERNEDPEAYDERLRQLGREAQEKENARAKAKGEKPKRKVGTNGFPLAAATKEEAIRVAVAADDLRSLVTYSQLMSAQGQTEMLSDWGSLFRAWQRTGAGRPKDKLLPEPYTGDIVNSTYTIIGPADKKTPNFRDIEVNQGTSLRRNSNSELRPYLAIDEIQFMRDAFVRDLCVFKYMKELDDVRLFGQLGVKFNMSFFPAYDKNGTAAGLGADGGYIAAEESVGAREFPYTGEDGKQHYDGMRGWEEAQKYCNDDVSLSTVIFSIPHMLKVLTDVPTPEDPRGKWGSAIPFHSSGATAKQLFLQGLGWVRAEDSKHPFEEEAFSDWDKGVTNFEQVQNDRFGDGWVAVGGKNDGKDMTGHKLEFSTASHYYNAELDLHMFRGALVKGEAYKQVKFNKDGTPNKSSLKGLEGATPLNIDYNDKVRELNSEYGYKEAADYYISFMQENGIVPRFHFTVPEDVYLKACKAGGVDPHDPKLGWKGEGNDWTPIDSPAYYSMFCDYGMTKADGKWSPQRPVGFINEQGEREFRMPDNTVEIVADAMRRYTERRQKENAMVADAERRFADMMVEQGKVTREQADEALSKKSFSERDSRSKGRQYSLDENVRSAEAMTETDPSDSQKESGNYRKGHVKVDGFDVSIEQPKGSVRRGVDADGKEWSQEMHNTYGYIRGTEGVDGDHIDVFLSDHLDGWNGKVFVVDQVNKDGSFDEHKVMYGFNSEQEARDAYLSNYEEGWTGLGDITGVSREEFKKWVDSSHRKTKPFAEYGNIVKEEPMKMTDEEKSGIRYSLVEDPEEIRRLDNEKLAEGFRNVSLSEDGTMRSPMADRLGSKGTEKRPTSSFEFRRWERSDENPDLATDDGKIDLGKPNGLGTVGNVDYNPYIHIRPTTVNKQFKNAWERDDLVYIRTQYPESELTSGYRADKAKKTVGRHDWNGGELILSRWDKPIEVVPWEEVADAWVDEFKERGVEFDIVPPKLLPILMERGVEILPPHKGMGKACNDAYREKVLGEGPDGPGGGVRAEGSQYINNGKRRFSLSEEQREAQTHSENFKRWFGDWERDPEHASKVVDKDGKPLVVYHQTNAKRWINRETGEDWEKLDWKKKQEWENKSQEEWEDAWEEQDFYEFDDRYARQSIEMPAIFFSPNNDPYHEYGQRTIAAYLDIKNPAINPDIPNRGVTDTAGRDAMEALKAQGYDGFIRTDEDGNILEYGVFSSEQIKSAEAVTYDDDGDMIPLSQRFDSCKKDIRYSLSEDLENYTPRGSQLEQNRLNALFRLAQENKESVERRKNAMREANRQLTELNDMFEGVAKDWDYHRGTAAARRGIAIAQKEYDRWTVDKLVGLAKEMLKSGLYKDLAPYETRRLVGLINKAAGKDDITRQANSVFDMLAKHQIMEWDKVLQKLLRIQSNKLSNQGVRVQGKLDVAGQTMIRTLKDAMAMDERSLTDAINDCRSRMGEDNRQIADNAANEYVGYMLAQQYHDGIKKTDAMMAALRAERREVEQEVYDIWREPMTDEDGEPVFNKITGERRTVEKRKLKPEFGGLDENGARQPVSEENKARRKQVDATLDSIDRGMRKLMVEQADNYRRMTDALGADVAASITRAKEWIDRDKERIGEIHHAANSDLLNVEEKLSGMDRSKEGGVANWGIVRFANAPLGSFEKFMRYFGQRSAYGEGRLFNKFMRGHSDCTHEEWVNYKRGLDEMNRKCDELFGCSWEKLMTSMRDGKKYPTIKISYYVEGKPVEDELTQDEAAYLIAVSKMLDGQMKLNRMGIDDAVIDQLRQKVDKNMLKLADWYQHEFLPKQRERYNEVYERMFGAPMAHIENYIHININDRSRTEDKELNQRNMSNDTPSTVTGSIKERKVNTKPIDLHTSLLDLAMEEHQKMEHWAAWAEYSRDLKELLNYKKFKNKVLNLKSIELGSGQKLWDKFEKTALIVTGDFDGASKNEMDRFMTNAAKFVSSGCINFRVHTALKQLLSFPAFMSDARPGDIAFAMANPMGSVQWAMENLPGFSKRWQGRRVGDTRLMETDSDYAFWRNKWVKEISKAGMTANASVDCMTVAVGARAVYETAKRRYKSYGYTEEQAERKAMQDAYTSYNSSQQSSEGAFVSPMQVERTFLSAIGTTFRNASMGYERRVTTGARNLARMLKKGYKADMIENTKKQMMEEGLTEEQAQRAAERVYNRQVWHSLIDVANFAYALPFLWILGPQLSYLIAGDDDELKKDTMSDLARHGLWGSIEGLTMGGVAIEVGNMLVNNLLDDEKELKDFWNDLKNKDLTPLPLVSRMSGLVKSFSKGWWEGANDLAGLIIQSNLGIDPNTVTDIGVAILDACNGDFGLAKESAIAAMRILQFPQSQIDQLYIDELGLNGKDVSKHSFEDLAKRYAKYKMRKGLAVPSAFIGDEKQAALEDKYVDRFSEKVADRLANLDADELSKNFGNGDAGLRNMVAKEVASRSGIKEDPLNKKPQSGDSERTVRAVTAYQKKRNFFDLAEDIMLEAAKERYKNAGAKEKQEAVSKAQKELKAILVGKDATTNNPEKKGLGQGEDDKILERYRKRRTELLKELKLK